MHRSATKFMTGKHFIQAYRPPNGQDSDSYTLYTVIMTATVYIDSIELSTHEIRSQCYLCQCTVL